MEQTAIQPPDRQERITPTPNVQSQARTDAQSTRNREQRMRPPVDIYETPEELVIMADMPGVARENLEIRVDSGQLTIRAKPHYNVRGDPVYCEFELGEFFRQFELGEDVDTEKISADLAGGLLTVRLPKKQQSRPKRMVLNVMSPSTQASDQESKGQPQSAGGQSGSEEPQRQAGEGQSTS